MNIFNKNLIFILWVNSFLSSVIISESWAVDCDPETEKVCQTGCIAKNLICNSCGATCGYTQVDGKVTLYGTGEAVRGYSYAASPFYNSSITSVKADSTSNFTSIGAFAFQNARLLKSIDMPNVTSIGQQAFRDASSLVSMDMTRITSAGEHVFFGITTDVIISDEMNNGNWSSYVFAGMSSSAKITCLGEVSLCKSKLNGKTNAATIDKVQPATKSQCNSLVNYYYDANGNSGNGQCQKLPNSQSACQSASLYWVGDKCLKACPGGLFPVSGECLPKRYTPAEVAKVVGESNTIFLYYK